MWLQRLAPRLEPHEDKAERKVLLDPDDEELEKLRRQVADLEEQIDRIAQAVGATPSAS